MSWSTVGDRPYDRSGLPFVRCSVTCVTTEAIGRPEGVKLPELAPIQRVSDRFLREPWEPGIDSSLDKGKPVARRGRKAKGLSETA